MHAVLTSRVLGDDAVLSLLARVGRRPRVYANLVAAGFPEGQLVEACHEFMRTAESPVARHAARRMNQGYFDDEDLLSLFTRFYDCADWRLEGSSLFFSADDYLRLYDELTGALAFEAALLTEGQAREKWEEMFIRLPFSLAMEKAKCSVWDGSLRRDHYWSRLDSYRDLRAENCFQYLSRVINVARFSKDTFFYHWEREFRVQLNRVLLDFHDALERAVRGWQEDRNKARNRARYRFRGFQPAPALSGLTLSQALLHLELDAESATLTQLRRNFRRLSKQAHPDQGGSAESFRYLSTCREIAENWLRARHEN